MNKAKMAEDIALERLAAGHYEVDIEGRVWRLANRRGARGKSRWYPCKPRRLEERTAYGYLSIRINDLRLRIAPSGRRVATCFAHRVVWRYHNGNIPGNKEINHKNGIKHDNRPENLEVLTRRENLRHSGSVLGNKTFSGKGEQSLNPKLTSVQVREIKQRLKQDDACVDIAGDYMVSYSAIYKIKRGGSWTHI